MARRPHAMSRTCALTPSSRRAEVCENPALKNSRWTWLKNKHSWTNRQIYQHHELSRMHLKIGRAFRLKVILRDIFMTATAREDAYTHGLPDRRYA